MKEVRNKTARPVRIALPGGKTLHLGPKKTAQIADGADEHPALQRLLKEGSIEILGEGERTETSAEPGAVGEQRGHARSTFRRRQGER